MRPRGIALLLGTVSLAAGCGSKQSTLDAHSKAARGIESLWWNMLIGAVLAFSLVALVLLLAWVRRHRPGIPRVRDPDRTGWLVVVALGLVIPIAVLSSLFLYSNIFLLRDVAPPAQASSNRPQLQIRVVGHQFWWEVRYVGTRAVTANEIHIPAQTPVELLLNTDDVIHSFWVPQLQKKVDMIPEQTNRLLLYADRPGRYRGQCAEFCGLQHAHMGLYVFADPPAVFFRWLAQQERPATERLPLFDAKCGSCHVIRGTPSVGNTGPDLTHLASRTSLAAVTIPNTRERLRQWLRDPQGVKPGNAMPAVALTDGELRRLVAYLEARR